MSSRNVIVSLVFVIILLGYLFIKMRYLEPRKKLTFNRNPSRIEYTKLALCRMECQNISANDITEIVRRGEINPAKSDLRKRPCAIFTLYGKTKKGMGLSIIVSQCGTVARITNCYDVGGTIPCNCTENNPPISSYKTKIDALPV